LPAPERARLDQTVLRIDALFRLHRRKAAAQKLDAAVRSLTRSTAPGIDPDERQVVISGLATYRNCLVETSPPPLATLTVRTWMQTAETSQDSWPPAPGGGYIYVDQIRVGRTAADGTATLQIPSGTSDIGIVLAGGVCGTPPSCAGSTTVDLPPGGSGTASVVVTDSKDPDEDTDIELVEPVDATLRASTSSFVLKFVSDSGVLVPVTKVTEVWVLDPDGDEHTPLDAALFRVARGTVRARDLAGLRAVLPAAGSVLLRVSALDRDGLVRSGFVRLRK
jgi:hypothetical protein